MAAGDYVLYAMPGSLYSGKARSYLRKQAIPFRERAPSHPSFQNEVIPAIGRWIIPVLQTPDGALIQDGAAIIDHFEERGLARLSAVPESPVQEVVARVLELYGGEGLLRPAMYYRWHFDAANLAFLERDFVCGLAPSGDAATAAAVFAKASQRMRFAGAALGATPQAAPAIEAAYLEFLALFEAHLQAAPYLLGGKPTLGDYGFIASLFAHLGRDPYPAELMKRSAHRVWRWVERMNAPEQGAGEYGDPEESLFPGDAVPASLKALLRFIAEDYVPEVEAYVAHANAWLAARPDLPEGSNGLDKPGERSIGMMRFPWRGQELNVSVLPYRLYLLQRIQDAAARADAAGQAAIAALLEEVGLAPLLRLKTARRVERRGNLEVWGPKLS